MQVRVHLNGRLVEEPEARVSVFDRGFLFGDAIFESMRASAGVVFRMDRHLARLSRSAALAGFPSLALGPMGAAVQDLLRANLLQDARIRVTVTRGPGRPGDYLESPGPPTVVISASPFTGLGHGLYEQGVAAAIPSGRAMPSEVLDPAIKTTSRLAHVLARREAREHGGFEAILVDAAGFLTEGTSSNLFLVDDSTLATPRVSDGSLPGITREAVIELARAAGMPVAEERLSADRLWKVDEVFLTNTSWEVLPVVSVDGKAVGRGSPGPVTRDLLARYRALVHRECGGG